MNGTEAVYNPNFEVGKPRLNIGVTPIKTHLSRSRLPSGKPQKVPNLVTVKLENGKSIDQDKVINGLNHLGHLSQKVFSLDFGAT